MKRLFIRFYIGVLVVLFLAWYLQGVVLKRWSIADQSRVYTQAHGGGARLVARELDRADSSRRRDSILQELNKRFDYEIRILSISELPEETRRYLGRGERVAKFRNSVVALLSSGNEVVRLGPFPTYGRRQVMESLAGWMRLTREKLEGVPADQQPRILRELQDLSALQLKVARIDEMPSDQRTHLISHPNEIAWYRNSAKSGWMSGILLSDAEHFLRFGPFPSFENNDQKAAATTLALVLLPAAIAIALLLRPMAWQLRQVENAAEAIAGGELSARVDEASMNSAKPLAHAFNHMAERTESLVQTQRELLQAVSHELRTPLSRMRFAIDLIGTAEDDAERQQRLASLDSATEELDGLVGELLSYVRLGNAEPQLEPESLSVQESLKALVSKFSAIHPAIDFTACEEGVGDLAVWADRPSFLRAIGNLLSNAGRYAKTRVRIEAQSHASKTIIDIDDNGQGIPEHDRERVFEPFVRLEEESNGIGRGVGLGLALVQRIVAQNGGTVQVLQSPLGGCRIRTEWPSHASELRSS